MQSLLWCTLLKCSWFKNLQRHLFWRFYILIFLIQLCILITNIRNLNLNILIINIRDFYLWFLIINKRGNNWLLLIANIRDLNWWFILTKCLEPSKFLIFLAIKHIYSWGRHFSSNMSLRAFINSSGIRIWILE